MYGIRLRTCPRMIAFWFRVVSYGDYLRCGAISRFAPVMNEVAKAAEQGKYVLGICNGFQIPTEAGLLPGALIRNTSLKFRCHDTVLKVANADTPFTRDYAAGEEIVIPIAHGEGNYYCDEETLASLQANNQIVFTYGNNPNGSLGISREFVTKQAM